MGWKRELLVVLGATALIALSVGCRGERSPAQGESPSSEQPAATVTATGPGRSVAGGDDERSRIRAPDGPLDTALAEVTLVSSWNDLATVRIVAIRDYLRAPGATYPGCDLF